MLFKNQSNYSCGSDNDCVPPLKCLSQARFSGRTCQVTDCYQSSDCPLNWRCIDRECLPSIICGTDSQCPRREVYKQFNDEFFFNNVPF